MISENNASDLYIHESIKDDLSTSAGSSDNDAPASGDDEPSPRSSTSSDNEEAAKAHVACLAKAGFMAELTHLPLSTLLELYAVFSTLLFSLTSKPQPPVETFISCNRPKARGSATHKDCFGEASKNVVQHQASRQPSPPPGLSLQHTQFHEDAGTAAENQRSYIEEIGAPPGLEAFACPPGLQLPHTATSRARQPTQVPLQDKRGRKKARPVATTCSDSNQPSTLPTTSTQEAVPATIPREFDQAAYRKELSDVLRDFGTSGNVATSVKRIRAQNVPREKQAAEFSDILTRAAESNHGKVRRLSFAFAAGLAVGQPDSAFDRKECERGLEYFFLEVFEDLAAEVPRLRDKLANELVPTLRTVFSKEELGRIVPPDCRAVRM